MIRNRLLLFMVLLLLGLFYIFFVDYFGFYLLLFACAVVLISLLLFLPGMFALRAALRPDVAVTLREAPFSLNIDVHNRYAFPFVLLRGELCFTNLFTGKAETRKIRAGAGFRGTVVREMYASAHCGLVRCELKRVRLFDPLGVFAVKKRKCKPKADVMVLPGTAMLGEPPVLEVEGMGLEKKSATRSNPGGQYELREYRPGDAMRNIHWKATAKMDELFVKEYFEPLADGVHLLLVQTEDVEQTEQALLYAGAFAEAMARTNTLFSVHFVDTQTMHPVSMAVETREDWIRVLFRLLAAPCAAVSPLGIPAGRVFRAQSEGLYDVNRATPIGGWQP